jgi:hypothetical protein
MFRHGDYTVNVSLSRLPKIRFLFAACYLLFFLCVVGPGYGQAPPPSRIILILTDGLTADDLSNPALPNLHSLAQTGQVGLMNVAVAGPRTDTNAMLTIALGALTPVEDTDGNVRFTTDSVEGASADTVFTRRTGTHLPTTTGPALVHLGVAVLFRRQLNEKLFAAELKRERAPKFIYVPGVIRPDAERLGGLLCVGERGWAIGVIQSPEELLKSSSIKNAVVDFANGGGQATHAALDRFLGDLKQHSTDARILLVSTHPPPNAKGEWDRLPPVVIAGPGITPGLLTSPTTRTPGLIANTDIAPTLLEWLDVSTPATMTGHPVDMQHDAGHLAAIADLDRAVTVNGHALDPLFIALGIIAGITVFGGLLALLVRPTIAPLFAFGVLWLMTMPLAMLLVPILRPVSVIIQSLETFGIMALPALFAHFVSKRVLTGIPAPIIIGALTVKVVLADAFFGQPLVKFSLFSAYQLQGIRFYGIGNEYMGVVTGLLLLWAFMMRVRPIAATAVFLFAIFVMGYPRLGANAGSIIGGVSALGAVLTVQHGKRLTVGIAALWTFLGLAATFVMAAIDKVLPGGAPSHFGGALKAADERGYGYLLEIVFRKVLMNLRILTSPGILAALIGICLTVLLFKTVFRDHVAELFRNQPDWARALPAVGYVALVSFIFNDSGIVIAVFVVGTYLATGLYYLLQPTTEKAAQ